MGYKGNWLPWKFRRQPVLLPQLLLVLSFPSTRRWGRFLTHPRLPTQAAPHYLFVGFGPLVLRLSALRPEGSEKSLLTFLFLAFYRFAQFALDFVQPQLRLAELT